MHVRHYAVTAEDEEEAKDLVYQRADSVIDCGYSEYSHELSRDTWSVEETTEDSPAS